jgi:hypothetical protein
MGRTNPTFRDVLRALEDRWQPFRRALRYEDQERFDQLLTHARNHADAAGNLNHQSPVIPVLVAIALAQERRLDELEAHMDDIPSKADDLSTGIDSE